MDCKTLAQAKTIFGIFADTAKDSVYYVLRNAAWTNLKTYTDTLYQAIGSYLIDAANDGIYYVRRNAAWTNLNTYTDTPYSIIGHTHKQIILLESSLEDATLAAGATNTAKSFRSELGGAGYNVGIPITGTLKNLYFKIAGT